jgi:hypothetical protein
MAMDVSLQQVFVEHFEAYACSRRLHPREQRAAWCISQCHRPALGAHVLECPAGHGSVLQSHACRHRSCPRCAEPARQQWLQRELQRLLPCEHFHVVFTLPHEFLALWQLNRTWFTQTLFDCARSSLLTLCAEPRLLGAMPGLLMALHTWGRNLSRHPHLHCLLSAGGLDPQGQWRSTRPGWALPLKPLQQLFRGKLLSSLKHALLAQRLRLPPQQASPAIWHQAIARQWRKHWNIQINPAYPHGRGVALYLARYVCGGPLGGNRRLHSSPAGIGFAFLDHRDGKRKHICLSPVEFIARILWHAPPKGQHTVRRAGLYASAHLSHHHTAQALLRPASPQPLRPVSATHAAFVLPPSSPCPRPPPACAVCSSPLTRRLLPPQAIAHHFGENSISRLATLVQPGPTSRSSGRPRASPEPAA